VFLSRQDASLSRFDAHNNHAAFMRADRRRFSRYVPRTIAIAPQTRFRLAAMTCGRSRVSHEGANRSRRVSTGRAMRRLNPIIPSD